MILPRYLHREELLFLSGLILEIKGDEMPAQLFVILLILWIQDEEDEVKPIKGDRESTRFTSCCETLQEEEII